MLVPRDAKASEIIENSDFIDAAAVVVREKSSREAAAEHNFFRKTSREAAPAVAGREKLYREAASLTVFFRQASREAVSPVFGNRPACWGAAAEVIFFRTTCRDGVAANNFLGKSTSATTAKVNLFHKLTGPSLPERCTALRQLL